LGWVTDRAWAVIEPLLPPVRGRAEASAVSAGDGDCGEGVFASFDPPAVREWRITFVSPEYDDQIARLPVGG
jgi:hypothetical protein